MQAAEPVAFFHLPAPQGLHAVPSAPVYPARQVQLELFAAENVLFGHAVQLVATADDDVFTPQAVHVALPVTFLYVPATQAVHTVPSVPVYPARQVQIELFADEPVVFGHAVQLVCAIAATVVE
jgi:hypothetical protein